MALPKKKTKSKCTQALANKICDTIAEGNSLKSTCEKLGLKYSTVYQWMKVFATTYFKDAEAAYQCGWDAMADECLKIAERSDLEPHDKRVQIDARIRLLGKWVPRKYGDKIQNEHSGNIGFGKMMKELYKGTEKTKTKDDDAK